MGLLDNKKFHTNKVSLECFKLLYDTSVDVILFLRPDGSIIEANKAAERVYGYTREELLNMKHFDIREERTLDKVDNQMQEAIKKGIFFETMHRRKNGEVFPVEVSAQSAIIGEERVILGIIRDITERKQAEATIMHFAYHDYLTGLSNRRHLNNKLTEFIKNAAKNKSMLAVLFVDLDGFKNVNDTLGHALGDELLQGIANKLSACFTNGEIVGRMGGDEFAILLPNIKDEYEAVEVCQRILALFNSPFIVDNQECYISASIGIAMYPKHGKVAEDLLKNADAAMYYAKEKGKNCYGFFQQKMSKEIVQKMELENKLRTAIDREEFQVYYQPQIDTVTGKMIGLEALLRWITPEKEIIPPAEFIPIAEESGLIIKLGEWVLKEVCRQNVAWQKAGYQPVKIAVNISANQFKQEKFYESVESILNETGLEPKCLELEITENLTINNSVTVLETLKKFCKLGVSISVDDFGIGFSSLNYLKKFPINTLKIDRYFIKDIKNDNGDEAIVKVIIALAQTLKLDTIAEGVETYEQLNLLKDLGCTNIQGYIFSKPIPPKIIEEKFLKKL